MGSVQLKHFEGSRNSIQETAGVLTMSFSGDAGGKVDNTWPCPVYLFLAPVATTVQLSHQGPQVFKSTLCEFACLRFLRVKALGDCLVTSSIYRLSAKQWSGMPSWHTDLHQVVVFK
ncbi:hypothetical protein I79_007145 [Cricetulus griseus]|uniref:Uncharacterized protein n=1 Tax=Cricetulus griseus TaxID=10029 RepID=G3H9R5_CRIGR|nr:hypothetical protein I79_007145 [Cricetulus griseus]